MSQRQYPIRYRVEFGDHPAEAVKTEGYAAADEMLIGSVVRFPDGKGSIAWHCTNGKVDGEMKSSTMFAAWLGLAVKISKDEGLNNKMREVVLSAINAAKQKIEKLT